jgi:hypothetical protein
MTPKEKAQELIKRYACLSRGENEIDWIDKDIIFDFFDMECALIAVDEILKSHYKVLTGVKPSIYNYYQEVKIEIENL